MLSRAVCLDRSTNGGADGSENSAGILLPVVIEIDQHQRWAEGTPHYPIPFPISMRAA